MTTALTAALVGAGFIGPVHAEALARIGVPLVGVLSSSAAQTQRMADTLGAAKAYRDFAELVADPQVDVVHIATPNRLHVSQARQALRAGKHVLCEKPLAMTSAESQELVALAAASGKAAGVCYNIRFYPLCLEARARIQRGDFGDVFSVTGSYVQDWLLKDTDYNWRVRAEDVGALRAVADIGTHWLDLARFISGLEVESVCADLRTIHPIRQKPVGEVQSFSGSTRAPTATEPIPVTTEDTGAILLRLRGGRQGVLWVSQVTAGRKNRLAFEIAGSRASMAWNSEEPETLWIGHRDGPNEVLSRDPSRLSDAARHHTDYPGGHVEGYPDTFKQLFRSFYDYAAAGDLRAAAPFPTFADGHREIELCEAIIASHRERRWVDCPPGDRT